MRPAPPLPPLHPSPRRFTDSGDRASHGPWLVALRLLQTLLTPLLLLVLLLRVLQGKEDPRRVGERLGWSGRRRPDGPLLWLHAASVGELTALQPLLRELVGLQEARGLALPAVLVTSVSRTSAALARQLLPAGVIHQMAPIDHWLALALFRRHWRPDLGVLVEAELWPELVLAMPRLHLLNARVSERSFRRHRRLPGFARWLYGRAMHCWAQSAADADRLRRLGVRRVEVVGSTKRDADPPPADPAIVGRLQTLLGGRRVLMLASSHPGEEALLLEAWPQLRQAAGPLALLLVPRHPRRAQALLPLCAVRGLRAGLWSALQASPEADTPAGPERSADLDVVVVDRLGAMGSWLALADRVVMGGSLMPEGRLVGGHNPLEPVRAGRRVVCGPDMANFAGLTEELEAAGWLHRLAAPQSLVPELVALLRSEAPPPQPLAVAGPSRQIARQLLHLLAPVPDRTSSLA